MSVTYDTLMIEIMKMRIPIHSSLVFMLVGLASCGVSADNKKTETAAVETPAATDTSAQCDENIGLINTVYDKFVFATDFYGDMAPETYFTANALEKLQDDYEFDCDDGPCYAWYALRTGAQDSNPETDGSSRIDSIEPEGDGWYLVSYSDMVWPGKTLVKIVNNSKIDAYGRVTP